MGEEYFSGAKPISELTQLIDEELHKHDLSKKNTLWATSVCSDEVNQSLHNLDGYFKACGPFTLGGISGIPFAGKTGFKAFVSHIPDKGGAVIVYGSHIGITKEGIIGKVRREGQHASTSCCGSLVAALRNVKNGNVLNITHDDYQQGQVNKMLIENYQHIKKSEDDIVAATEITLTQIKQELSDIVSNCIDSLQNKHLLLIGGIIINKDWDQEDLFDVRDITWFKN